MEELLSIRQVSTVLQVEVSTIRFWEKEFAEYLNLNVPKGQRNRYTQEHIEFFSKVKDLLQSEQYTIKGAKRRLELDGISDGTFGMENNFKNTVINMLTGITQELQAAREESRKLAREVEKLRTERSQMELQLFEEQNKSLMEFLRHKLLKVSEF